MIRTLFPVLLLVMLPSIPASCQCIITDTIMQQDNAYALPEAGSPDLSNTLILDFFSSIDGFSYINPELPEQHNNFFFFTTLSLNNTTETCWATLRTAFNGEYGMRSYTDSVTTKSADQYEYKIVLEMPLLKRKQLQAQCGINVKSQFWKSYSTDDTAGLQHLYSDYFSPGYILYTAGFSYHFLESATLDIGLVGGQTTRIGNQQIFEERNSDELYGVPRGDRKKTEFGISLQLTIPPHKWGKHFGWSCTGQTFASKEQIGRLAGYSFSVNNSLHYIFLKYLRLSLNTQVTYNETVSNRVFLQNHLSLGFYLSNSL